jgi:Uma2 family endonuclease
MAGGSVRHNTICGNFFAELRAHLKGKPCKVFIADVKARILAFQQETFYYPDVMVGCDERDTHDQYRRFPKLIIEVLSESTERLDRREKLERYITIPTLEEYVLVEQQRPRVTIHRRKNEWKGETVEGLTTVLELESVGLSLPLAAFYEDVSPSAGEG